MLSRFLFFVLPTIFHIICVHINALKKAVKKKGTMYYEEKRNHKNKRNQESNRNADGIIYAYLCNSCACSCTE